MMLAARIPRVCHAFNVRSTRGFSTFSNIANALYQKACDGELWTSDEMRTLVRDMRANNDAHTPMEMSKALYGLMHMKGSCREELDLVEALRHKLDSSNDLHTLDGRHLCMSLCGIQSLKIRNGPTSDLVNSLSAHLRNFKGSIDLKSLLMAFRGLAGMDGQRMEVRRLMASLTEMLRDHLKAGHFSLTRSDVFDLMGVLRDKECGTSEMTDLLNLLSQTLRHIDLTSQPLSEQETRSLLQAIQSMGRLSSSHKEVTSLLRGINTAMEAIRPDTSTGESVPLDAVLGAVEGLGRMSTSQEEVRVLLVKLTTCLDSTDAVSSAASLYEGEDSLNGEKYGNALFGMRNLTSASREARGLLRSILDAMSRENNALLEAASEDSALMTAREAGQHDGQRARRLLPEIRMSLTACAKGISGLRNMFSERKEVREAVLILGHMLREKGRKLSGKVAKGEVKSDRQEIITDEQLYLIGRGLHGMSTDFLECRSLLGALRGRLDTRLKQLVASRSIEQNRLSPLALSTLLNGLENASCEHEVVDKLIKIIYYELKRPPPMYLSPLHLSMALRGMKRMDDSAHNVERLVDALVVCHHEGVDLQYGESVRGREKWEPAQVCRALSGMQLMKAGCREVRKLLALVADRMYRVRLLLDRLSAKTAEDSFPRPPPFAPYSPKMIAEAVLGMRSMSSHYYVVSDLIIKLAREADLCEGATWTDSELGMIMVGLSNMSSSDDAVKSMLQVIIKKLRDMPIRGRFSPTASVDVIYGLKMMGSDSSDVITLLHNVLPHLTLNELKPYQLSKVFTGLRGISNVHVAPYVVNPPAAIMFDRASEENKAHRVDGVTTPVDVTFNAEPTRSEERPASYGIQWKQGEPVIAKLLERLAVGVNACQGSLSASEFATTIRSVQFLQSGPFGSSTYNEPAVRVVEAIIQKMTEEIDDAMDVSMCCRSLYGLLGFASDSSILIDTLRQSLLTKLMVLSRRADKSGTDDVKTTEDIFRPIEQTVHFHLVSEPGYYSPAVMRLLQDMLAEQVGKKIARLALGEDSDSKENCVVSPVKSKDQRKARSFEEMRSKDSTWVIDADDMRQSTIEMKFAEHFQWFVKEDFPMVRSKVAEDTGTGKIGLPVRVTFSHNEVLMGCHTDFLLRVYDTRNSMSGTNDSKEDPLILIYNVEIDGPLHKRVTSKHFAANRDKILTSLQARTQLKASVIVRRIDVSPTNHLGVPLLSFSGPREKVMQSEAEHFNEVVKSVYGNWVNGQK